MDNILNKIIVNVNYKNVNSEYELEKRDRSILVLNRPPIG